MRRELPQGMVALLFTDIEGSTRTLRSLGGGYEQTVALHRDLVRAAAARHGGVEVDTQGDSFFIAFARASGALAAAALIQRSLSSARWPKGVPVRVRIGVHAGEPTLGSEGYVGLDVHRAARICAAAHGGQVVVSVAVRALVGEKPLEGAGFRDLGAHRLRDFGEPERLFQLVAPGLAAAFPPLRTASATNLPALSSPLVDRLNEVAEIERLLAGPARLVTLVGAGGAGKSRLALEVATRAIGGPAHGVFVVRLAPISSSELVAAEIARAIGLQAIPDRSVESTLVDHLASRDILLVLDNLEHLLGAPAVIGRMLFEAPGMRALATSRGPLRLADEHVVVVDPLSENDAIELFAARARAADGRFTLTMATESQARAICRRLDGLPLAIELAAARVGTLGLSGLLDRLKLSLLTGGASDAPERHRTLAATIAWSVDQLSQPLKVLYGQLGVFAGRFTLEAAEHAFGADIHSTTALVDAGLIRRHDDGGATRLGMLRTIREDALARLDAAGAWEDARERHAAWVDRLAAEAADGLSGESLGGWLRSLELDLPDIRAALDRSEATGERDRVVRIVSALERFWRAHGHVAEARSRLERALADGHPADPKLRARGLWTLGRLATAQGDRAAAAEPIEEALALFRRLGQAREEVFALTELAWSLLDHGDVDDAKRDASLALEVARRAVDARALASALMTLAAIAAEQGAASEARIYAEECLAIRRGLGDRLLIANAAFTLGSAALAQGDLEAAGQALTEALEIALALGDGVHAAAARCCLGEAAILRGDDREADELLRTSLADYVGLGDDRAAAECLVGLARLEARNGRMRNAVRLRAAAAAARERLMSAPLPVERLLDDEIVAAAAATLDASAIETAESAGRTLGIVEAALAAGLDPVRAKPLA